MSPTRSGVMRSVGPGLILVGALATLGAMFLPYLSFGGISATWWQWLDGIDIALGVACGLAGSLALLALVARHEGLGYLAGIAGAVAFGFAFAPVPGAIDDSAGARAGLWVVAGTGTVALAGSVVTILGRARRERLGRSYVNVRKARGWIAVAAVGALAVAALAVADPFGYDKVKPRVPTEELGPKVLDAVDATEFATAWARKRERPGETAEAGCEDLSVRWPPRFACDIRYRHAPPGYKVIRRRSSELHVRPVKPQAWSYSPDGEPLDARDLGRRNRWRIIVAISLGGESKLERKVRSALGLEVDGAYVRRVRCSQQLGRLYSCTARLTSGRCRKARIRDVPSLTVDDIRFKPARKCEL